MSDMADEEWREIPGFAVYDVSNHGRIRSHRRSGSSGRVLSGSTSSKGGYAAYGLNVDGKRVMVRAHVMVARAFIGERPPGYHVRHLDGDTSNNRLSNLAYGSASENEKDKSMHGTHHHGSRTHCYKGHEYTPENTYHPPGTNDRVCRTCKDFRRARSLANVRARAKREASNDDQ